MGIHLSDIIDKGLKKAGLNIPKQILAIICIVVGLLVIFVPTLVGFMIGAFLLYTAIVLLIEYYDSNNHKKPKQPRTSKTQQT